MELTQLLIALGIAILIILVLLGVNIWYWRINDLIKNQQTQVELLQKQNDMLKNIFTQLGGKIELQKNTVQLTYNSDLQKVDTLKKLLKKDEVIVKIKQNGKIEMWSEDDWNDVVKNGNENKFELIFISE